MNGTKQAEEVMGSGYIQSLIITRLIVLLSRQIGSDLELLTSELGLQSSKNSRRAVDIVIIEKAKLEQIKDVNKYLDVPPKYVIEVDIKASKERIEDSTSYYHSNTDQLLEFGVECVVWIFTPSKKIMIAQRGKKNWETSSWDVPFDVIEEITIDLNAITQ
jgi:Uma2 family endonuclease